MMDKLSPTDTASSEMIVFVCNQQGEFPARITSNEFLEKFPTSKPAMIYNTFKLPFVRCLRVFLTNYFGGDILPLYNIGEIKGVPKAKIAQWEKFYKNHVKKK